VRPAAAAFAAAGGVDDRRGPDVDGGLIDRSGHPQHAPRQQLQPTMRVHVTGRARSGRGLTRIDEQFDREPLGIEQLRVGVDAAPCECFRIDTRQP
jgi:hypothetical protein